MKMKAALASALAYRPRLILLDEPFSGLDPLVRDDFIQGLLARASGATILISSHDLAEVESFVSHIGYLDAGRIQFSEEPSSPPFLVSSVERFGNQYWQTMNLDSSILEILKNETVNLEVPLSLTLVTDKVQTRIPVTERSFGVPHLGHCFSAQRLGMTDLACRAGLSSREMSVDVDDNSGRRGDITTAPASALPSGLSPVSNTLSASWGGLKVNAHFVFIPRRDIVTFERTLTLREVKLAEYVVRQ
jgi:energy-coupling factor transporter ATP-binding protein EcfA2